MKILAIDPGPVESAVLLYDTEARRPLSWAKTGNEHVRDVMYGAPVEAGAPIQAGYPTFADMLAVEMIASYGMAVGAEVFDTCVWIGRFVEAWEVTTGDPGWPVRMIYRREVKSHLCGSQKAGDSNIRTALVDRWGPGKELAIGRKASPGPLYGITGDGWSALAVAVTAAETSAREAA